jgi:histidinol-phosphate aminotransferase
VKARVDEVIENRSRLTDELRSFGLRPLPSDANFLLVPIPPAGGGADRLVAALRAQDIIVRQFTAVPGIGDAIRITIGPWPIMERLLSVVGQTLASLGTPPGIGAAP